MLQRKRIRLASGLYRTEGQPVSVTACTAGRELVFVDLSFGRECVDLLGELSIQTEMKVLAYCLMPDHAHLLLSSNGESSVIEFMRAWKSKSYHVRRNRGHAERLWQRSFHDHLLRKDEDVRAVCRYIVGNSVRAGIVSEARDYPLSGSFEFQLW